MGEPWVQAKFGEYYKKLLFSAGRLTTHLIRLPEGSYIAPHIDEKPELRINIEILRPSVGGQFYCYHRGHLFKFGRLTVYQPHRTVHATVPAYAGSGLILTFGWTNFR